MLAAVSQASSSSPNGNLINSSSNILHESLLLQAQLQQNRFSLASNSLLAEKLLLSSNQLTNLDLVQHHVNNGRTGKPPDIVIKGKF